MSAQERANDAERSFRDAGNDSGDVLDRWVRDGVTMSTSRSGPIAQSASDIVDSDAPIRRTANSELATVIRRFRVNRAQRHREQREFKTWLEVTATPLYCAEHPEYPEGPRRLLRSYVQQGRLGVKSGAGFYDDYPRPAEQPVGS